MASKKSFLTNNVFLSNMEEKPKGRTIKTPVPSEPTEKRDPVPEGYRLVPEAKSRRLQLLVRPSLYEKMQNMAKAEGISFNELANRAFENIIESYLKYPEV